MFGDWVLIVLMIAPIAVLGAVRFYWLKCRGKERKATIMAAMLIVSLSMGAYKRYEMLKTMHREDPQSFRFNSNPWMRTLYAPSTAPVTYTDAATGQEVFTYYRTEGAARLNSIEQPASNEWLVTFSINVGEPDNHKLRSYFETEVTDNARVLPLTRLYRSMVGRLRVEDVQTGQTIFSYDEKSTTRPVETSKVKSDTGVYEWQVRFANAPGLYSQTMTETQH